MEVTAELRTLLELADTAVRHSTTRRVNRCIVFIVSLNGVFPFVRLCSLDVNYYIMM